MRSAFHASFVSPERTCHSPDRLSVHSYTDSGSSSGCETGAARAPQIGMVVVNRHEIMGGVPDPDPIWDLEGVRGRMSGSIDSQSELSVATGAEIPHATSSAGCTGSGDADWERREARWAMIDLDDPSNVRGFRNDSSVSRDSNARSVVNPQGGPYNSDGVSVSGASDLSGQGSLSAPRYTAYRPGTGSSTHDGTGWSSRTGTSLNHPKSTAASRQNDELFLDTGIESGATSADEKSALYLSPSREGPASNSLTSALQPLTGSEYDETNAERRERLSELRGDMPSIVGRSAQRRAPGEQLALDLSLRESDFASNDSIGRTPRQGPSVRPTAPTAAGSSMMSRSGLKMRNKATDWMAARTPRA